MRFIASLWYLLTMFVTLPFILLKLGYDCLMSIPCLLFDQHEFYNDNGVKRCKYCGYHELDI